MNHSSKSGPQEYPRKSRADESQASGRMLHNLEVVLVPEADPHTKTSSEHHNLDVDKEINNFKTRESVDPLSMPSLSRRPKACQELNETLKPHLSLASMATSKTSIANRFTDAQRDRTLRHHKLIQPTPSQERAHLSSLSKHSHLSSLSEVQRMSFSNLSLLSLPESDVGEDEEVMSLDLKQFSYANKSCTQSSSDRSTSSLTIEEDTLSEESPTTTLVVPSQSYDQVGDISAPKISSVSSTMDLSKFEYCQPCCEMESHSSSHRMVICADTQFGITEKNNSWQLEMQYSVNAVDLINSMVPQPAFVCVCGDLVDMEYSFEKKKGKKSQFPSSLFNGATGVASREVCDAMQDEQNEDFKKIWATLKPDIALVCLCGNHDVGNRPTPRSISRFKASFGDEYLAFWTNGTYNIVLNNVLFVDPSGARIIYNKQLRWLENRLQYATSHQAENIFILSHHPWFLYDEEEDPDKLMGASPYPEEWRSSDDVDANLTFPDSYFSMPLEYRKQALDLFRQYNVKACFSGHFHQNLVSKTRWGMDMIITAPLSTVFESTGKQLRKAKMMMEEERQDFLDIHRGRHRRKTAFDSKEAMLSRSSSDCDGDDCSHCKPSLEDEVIEETNCRGVRVVDVQVNSGFSHFFVPL